MAAGEGLCIFGVWEWCNHGPIENEPMKRYGENLCRKGKGGNFPFPAAVIPASRAQEKDRKDAELIISAKTLTPRSVKE
jgi:hypothetical protein